MEVGVSLICPRERRTNIVQCTTEEGTYQNSASSSVVSNHRLLDHTYAAALAMKLRVRMAEEGAVRAIGGRWKRGGRKRLWMRR